MHNASASIPPAFHAGVGSSRTIDVHVRRIRAALAKKSEYGYVHTVRGLGYRLGSDRLPGRTLLRRSSRNLPGGAGQAAPA